MLPGQFRSKHGAKLEQFWLTTQLEREKYKQQYVTQRDVQVWLGSWNCNAQVPDGSMEIRCVCVLFVFALNYCLPSTVCPQLFALN